MLTKEEEEALMQCMALMIRTEDEKWFKKAWPELWGRVLEYKKKEK